MHFFVYTGGPTTVEGKQIRETSSSLGSAETWDSCNSPRKITIQILYINKFSAAWYEYMENIIKQIQWCFTYENIENIISIFKCVKTLFVLCNLQYLIDPDYLQ